jgi:hypothetical protein
MARRLTQEINLDSGVVVKETYRRDRKLHRDPSEGPAIIERDAATGRVIVEEYYVDNRWHREDGPAVLICNPKSGAVVKEYYLLSGRLHRDPAEGPAYIKRSGVTGKAYIEEYYLFGDRVEEPERPGGTQGRTTFIRKPST